MSPKALSPRAKRSACDFKRPLQGRDINAYRYAEAVKHEVEDDSSNVSPKILEALGVMQDRMACLEIS
uniref:Uncharacterized protein n=1 Tax=Peronospora matthiolae TaxID=2874970 RepID=A0AAV1VGM9_9STRA